MRLIDADALKTKFENKKSTIQNRIMGVQMDSIAIAFYEIFIEAIDKQPTVDAVPVIHAKWVQNPYSDEPPTCSHCGFESSYYYDRSKSVIENRNGVLLSEAKSKYCPNCGAEMDGGKADADS